MDFDSRPHTRFVLGGSWAGYFGLVIELLRVLLQHLGGGPTQ